MQSVEVLDRYDTVYFVVYLLLLTPQRNNCNENKSHYVVTLQVMRLRVAIENKNERKRITANQMHWLAQLKIKQAQREDRSKT